MTTMAASGNDAPEAARRRCSLTQTAALFGVHRNTVAKWLDQGAPAVTRADRDRGVEWELDMPAMIEWRVKRAVEDAVSGLGEAEGKVSKDEADRRRAVAMAITAEVEADEALKSVVSRFDAESAMADFCQALRSGLSNAGSKIAGRTAAMTSPAEIRELCEAEINRAFQAAESDLAERWSNDGPSGDDDIGED